MTVRFYSRPSSRNPTRLLSSCQSRHLRFSSAKSPVIIASLDSGPSTDPISSSPRDAKGQAKVAIRTFGSIFRAFAYTGLGLGLAASVGFVGLHLWVENFELPPGRQGPAINDDQYRWQEEIQGWGAGYLKKGTDQRIGWRARCLVRAAWVAQHWQTGQAAASPEASNFAGSNRLVDSAYALAETRLQQAVFMAKEAGLKLDEQNPPDRGLVELQNRLAEVCVRINTPLSLMKAFQIYTQIWSSCVASIEREAGSNSEKWEKREALRTARRLGEVGLGLATLERTNDDLRSDDGHRQAEQYLVWAATTGLSNAVGDGDIFRASTKPSDSSEVTKTEQGSWWNWLGKPTDVDTTLSSSKLSGPLKPEVDLIYHTLKCLTHNQPHGAEESIHSISPVLARFTIASILRLSLHLATLDLSAAYQLQSLTKELVRSLDTKQVEENLNSSPDALLHHLWLQSREALLSVYLAELGQVTKQLDEAAVVRLGYTALDQVDNILSTFKAADQVYQLGKTRTSSGRLSEQAKALRMDSRITAAMASNLIGLKLTKCSGEKKQPSWCQSELGQQSSKEFFERALTYSSGTDGQDEKLVQLEQESLENLGKIGVTKISDTP